MQTPTLPVADGVALGRVAGALLVPHEDVPDLGRVHQRVVRREDRAAGDAEDRVDPDALEGPDQALRTGDLDRAGGPYRRREVGRRRVLGAGAPRVEAGRAALPSVTVVTTFECVPCLWSGPGRARSPASRTSEMKKPLGPESDMRGSARTPRESAR